MDWQEQKTDRNAPTITSFTANNMTVNESYSQ